MDIRVSDYKSRADLEAYVNSHKDLAELLIVGTADEFAAKQISETTTIYGVHCKIISE